MPLPDNITIIDNTIPYSPILEYKPPPSFRTEIEKQKYYEGEKKKWIEGVGEVPGTLYHKTMMQKLKNRNSGETELCECRDVDLMIHQSIRDCRAVGEAELIIKGRGIGLSTDMGCLSNYFMRVYPGSTTLMTSANQSKLSSLFTDKFKFTYDNYIPEFIPPIKRINQTAKNVYIRSEVKFKNKDGSDSFSESEIYCLETADNDKSASAFSGKGCIFAAFDETFLHARRNLLLRSSSPCFIEQKTGKVVAFLLAGGTCEDTLKNEELVLLQTMIRDVEKNKVLGTIPAHLLFIPATWGKFTTNGHTDFKKAQEWHDKEIERLSKLEDPDPLRAFRMNNPLSLEDIFELEGGGMYSEKAIEKTKIQLKRVTEEDIPQIKYNIVEMRDKFEIIPNKKGKITIHEIPVKGIEYYLNIDGVGSGVLASGEDGSKVGGLMMKTFDPHPIKVGPFGVCAKYFDRPSSIEQSYSYLTDLAKYFNMFGGFKGFSAEGNMGMADHFSTYLYKIGMGHFIIMRKDLSGKGNTNTKRFFQYIDKPALDYQIRQASPFLEKYVENIIDVELLQQILLPKTANADLRSAFHMFMIALPPDFDRPIVKRVAPLKKSRTIILDSNGYSKEVWTTEYPDDGTRMQGTRGGMEWSVPKKIQ